MFKVRAVFAVSCAEGPIVVIYGHIFSAKIKHRLQSDNHPRHEFLSLALFPEIWNEWIFVNCYTHAVPGENFHNAVFTLLLPADVALYRITYVSYCVPRPGGINAYLERLLGSLHKFQILGADFADGHSDSHIGKKSFVFSTQIKGHDVPFF